MPFHCLSTIERFYFVVNLVKFCKIKKERLRLAQIHCTSLSQSEGFRFKCCVIMFLCFVLYLFVYVRSECMYEIQKSVPIKKQKRTMERPYSRTQSEFCINLCQAGHNFIELLGTKMCLA